MKNLITATKHLLSQWRKSGTS